MKTPAGVDSRFTPLDARGQTNRLEQTRARSCSREIHNDCRHICGELPRLTALQLASNRRHITNLQVSYKPRPASCSIARREARLACRSQANSSAAMRRSGLDRARVRAQRNLSLVASPCTTRPMQSAAALGDVRCSRGPSRHCKGLLRRRRSRKLSAPHKKMRTQVNVTDEGFVSGLARPSSKQRHRNGVVLSRSPYPTRDLVAMTCLGQSGIDRQIMNTQIRLTSTPPCGVGSSTWALSEECLHLRSD